MISPPLWPRNRLGPISKRSGHTAAWKTPRPDGRGVFARQTGRETCGMEKPQYTAAHLKGMNRHVVYDFIREQGSNFQSADRQGNGHQPAHRHQDRVVPCGAGPCGGGRRGVRPAWDAGRSCWPSTAGPIFGGVRAGRFVSLHGAGGHLRPCAPTGRKHARRRISARFWPRCATGW